MARSVHPSASRPSSSRQHTGAVQNLLTGLAAPNKVVLLVLSGHTMTYGSALGGSSLAENARLS